MASWPDGYDRRAVPTLEQVAAVFTIAGGSLALIQLTAILVRLNRRPRLQLRVGSVRELTEDGRSVTVLQIVTTNAGTLSARNILWNYDLPPGCRVIGSDAERHEREGRTTIARDLDHLHPNVETHHELSLEVPSAPVEFEVRYRVHLEDARPQAGVLRVSRPAAAERQA